MNKEIYTRTLITADGTVAVTDCTDEIKRLKLELKRPAYEASETLSVKEVAKLLKISHRTVQNKISAGYFAEGVHYKRLSKRHVVFYKKPLMKLLGIS